MTNNIILFTTVTKYYLGSSHYRYQLSLNGKGHETNTLLVTFSIAIDNTCRGKSGSRVNFGTFSDQGNHFLVS